jgi:hypothetical protein
VLPELEDLLLLLLAETAHIPELLRAQRPSDLSSLSIERLRLTGVHTQGDLAAQVAAQRRTLYPTLENDPPGACHAPSQRTHGSSCAGIRSFRWRPRRLLSGASSLQLQVLDFQKANEYGEVSLVDLGWRGKSASEPRDR